MVKQTNQFCATTDLCANIPSIVQKEELNDSWENGLFTFNNWIGNCWGGRNEYSDSLLRKKDNEEHDDDMQDIHRKRRYWEASKADIRSHTLQCISTNPYY